MVPKTEIRGSVSGILNSGFEQIYLLQNNLNHSAVRLLTPMYTKWAWDIPTQLQWDS